MKFFFNSWRMVLLGVCMLALAPVVHAQIRINVNPPSWGPAVPAGAQYYYIPEANSFYDVPARQYVVSRDGRWIRTATLAGFNSANFHPVVIDYVGAQPWTRYDEYRNRYPRRNPSNGGLPPGQAKKLYRRGYENGQYDNRRDDDRDDRGRGKYKDYKDKDKGHRDDDRGDRHDDDDHGHGNGKHGDRD